MDHRDWGGGGLRSGGSLQEGSLFGARWSGMSSLEEVALEGSRERRVAVRQVRGGVCGGLPGGGSCVGRVLCETTFWLRRTLRRDGHCTPT